MRAATVRALVAVVGAERVTLGASLAQATTFRVGGPADCLVEARDAGELAAVLGVCRREAVPCTILGGGSNTLISDEGIRGVVVRAHGGRLQELGELVAADAGVSLNSLVRWTIGRGLGGLEAWAGTPGTVGGAVFGNAHYAGRSIGELVASATLMTPTGAQLEVPGGEMAFAYDRSRLQRSGEILLAARFHVRPGADPARLREVARASLAYRKRTQPLHLPSAGCIFQNPDPRQVRLPEGVPPSAGALVDRAGLKGRARGGARVSPSHANFIVNEGGATAREIYELVAECREAVKGRFGIELALEIRLLGFRAVSPDS
jgi:UDP-N-acetylmuramate dehydrogenase